MPGVFRAVWMVLRDKHWLEISKLARLYHICSCYISMKEKKLAGASS